MTVKAAAVVLNPMWIYSQYFVNTLFLISSKRMPQILLGRVQLRNNADDIAVGTKIPNARKAIMP